MYKRQGKCSRFSSILPEGCDRSTGGTYDAGSKRLSDGKSSCGGRGGFKPSFKTGDEAVSYTHLDVYKRQGRNLAVIVESAAVNHRQKKMGYNAAEELYRRVQESISRKR